MTRWRRTRRVGNVANVECLKCRHLVRIYKEIPVKRSDGTNEVAGWYECGWG